MREVVCGLANRLAGGVRRLLTRLLLRVATAATASQTVIALIATRSMQLQGVQVCRHAVWCRCLESVQLYRLCAAGVPRSYVGLWFPKCHAVFDPIGAPGKPSHHSHQAVWLGSSSVSTGGIDEHN